MINVNLQCQDNYKKEFYPLNKYSADEEKYFREVISGNNHINNEKRVDELIFLFSCNASDNVINKVSGYYRDTFLKYKDNILNKFKDKKSDIFFTPNSYRKGSDKPLKNNLFNIYSIALDVDYKVNGSIGNKKAKPENFFWDVISPLCGELIPTPNYIEVGHQLRLIYVLAEPIYAKNKKMIDAVNVTLKRLSEMLNNELDCGCEPQKINSYYRLPGSTNSKDGSVVHVHSITDEKWTIQEIMDEFLPELPEWYDTWISKKGKKKVQLHNYFILWINRMHALKAIQQEDGINRENILFLYAQYLIWTKEELKDEEMLNMIIKFNEDFKVPLLEKEIRSKLGAMLKSRKKYRFKNKTLSEFAGIELNIETSNARAAVRAERIANGDMRWQKTDAKAEEVKKLKAEGKTNKVISEILGISVRQVQRLNQRNINSLGISLV